MSKRWFQLIVVAAVAAVFGFGGAALGVALFPDQLRGPAGPQGPHGQQGQQGEPANEATLVKILNNYRSRIESLEAEKLTTVGCYGEPTVVTGVTILPPVGGYSPPPIVERSELCLTR